MAPEARQLGVTEAGLIRLLMQSMPQDYVYVEDFVAKECRSNFDAFARDLEFVCGDKSRSQMSSFFNAHRKKGENLLSYFSRLKNLYSTSKQLRGEIWQSDPSHTASIYTKMYDSMYPEIQSMLQQKTDTSFEAGTLTLEKLKEVIVEINKLSKQRIATETIQSINAVEKKPIVKEITPKVRFSQEEEARAIELSEESLPTFKSRGQNQTTNKQPFRGAPTGGDGPPMCWFCKKVGHFRAECISYKRWKKNASRSFTREDRGPEGI